MGKSEFEVSGIAAVMLFWLAVAVFFNLAHVSYDEGIAACNAEIIDEVPQ